MKLRLPDLIRKPFYFQEIFGSIILKGRHSGENGNPNPIERQINKSLPILKMPHPIAYRIKLSMTTRSTLILLPALNLLF